MPHLESEIGRLLIEQGATLATAESCSGGLIAHRITNVPGSSHYFLGGVVSYSNAAKESLIGVSANTLGAHGAVSESVAREMAEGVRARFGSGYATACTGIAGPSGGTADKPVGLVYIGVTGPKETRVERCRFVGDREEIKQQTADRALELLKEMLE